MLRLRVMAVLTLVLLGTAVSVIGQTESLAQVLQ